MFVDPSGVDSTALLEDVGATHAEARALRWVSVIEPVMADRVIGRVEELNEDRHGLASRVDDEVGARVSTTVQLAGSAQACFPLGVSSDVGLGHRTTLGDGVAHAAEEGSSAMSGGGRTALDGAGDSRCCVDRAGHNLVPSSEGLDGGVGSEDGGHGFELR